MDMKINLLNLKRKYLSARVHKLTGLSKLYTDYIEFIKEEHVKNINRKVLSYKQKLYKDFQKKYFDIAEAKETYNVVFEAKYAELKKKKRLEFRAYREKTRRKIAKLKLKDGNETLISELEHEIAVQEAIKNKEVETISNHWKAEFQKEIEAKTKQNPSDVEVSNLKQDTQDKIDIYRDKINESSKKLLEKRLKYYTRKRDRFIKRLEKVTTNLKNVANNYFDLLSIKSKSDTENKIAKLNEEITKAEKTFAHLNDEKASHDKVEKQERLINELKNELEAYKATLKDEKVIANDEVLNIKGLCMFFGGIKAVNNLSFSVKKKEIFGLIGPNGAGKTTVFNCITQFYKPTRGQISFRNKNNEIVNLVNEKTHNVILQGVIRTFQNLEVIKDITVLDNLLIAAHRYYTSNLFQHMFHTPLLNVEEKVIRKRAVEVLEFMGLLKYKDMYAWGLPYGILKKIEIARTLMCNPQLIILDEPAAGLNDSETVELTEIIKKIRDKYDSTILLVEHDMGLVMNVCDRICAISFGNLLGIGTPEEIQQNKAVQEAYLGVSED